MVKTRHSGGTDGAPMIKNERNSSSGAKRNGDHSALTNGYDSDEFQSIKLPSPRKTRKQQTMEEDDDTPPKRSSRSRRPRRSPVDYDELHTAASTSSRHSHRSKGRIASPAASGDFSGPRRSGRQRKSLYATYNQNDIDDHMTFLTDGALAPETDDESPIQVAKRRKVSSEKLDSEEARSMYDRVKRERRAVKRDMYGLAVTEGEETNGDESEVDTTEAEDDGEETEEETEEEEDVTAKQYNLRQHKPRTSLYVAPAIEPKTKRQSTIDMFRDTSPLPGRQNRKKKYFSPARRKSSAVRKRAQFHGSDTTSSSDSGNNTEDADEQRFERRKAKSMAKSRAKHLPMNFETSDITGTIRDRQRIGASMADVDPMSVDKSVTFDSVGGLGQNLEKLKEMIVFPLMYPEVFDRFKIDAPRGCLFYGPPGTGKTLVARALANECSHGNKKVAFFMRKGADCLSKWVGESERQLRLLFDQAYQNRPSVIFFDEIDGLAPVRSSRQDQIHASIVSTLLALMDGLDSRGEVVVIGATNRIDSIDPALRRPGRFDREFFFGLPSVEARKQILSIHTKAWQPAVSQDFIGELAERTVGYCGADLKALCTEAALHALKRRYPQIYQSSEKLKLDVNSINLIAKDFHRATQCIVPAAQRAVTSPARCLVHAIKPLMQSALNVAIRSLAAVFPKPGSSQTTSGTVSSGTQEGINLDIYSDSDDEGETIHDLPGQSSTSRTFLLNFTNHAYHRPAIHRPRLLLSGDNGQGQTTHLAPAVLHHMEGTPVHTLDLPSIHAVNGVQPEESLSQIVREAKRTSPSILYMPHINEWWLSLSDACRSTFLTLLDDIAPDAPILLLATSEVQHSHLSPGISNLFSIPCGEVIVMLNPNEDQRRDYFEDLFFKQATKAPSTKKRIAQRVLEVLPVAPAPEPRKLTESEKIRLYQKEENTLRELRLFLRDTLNKLGRDRKFTVFSKPVDEEEVPDYSQVIEKPMDMGTMMTKIDLGTYLTAQEFLDDINLICTNALEYNPETDAAGRALRHRACSLRDTATALITVELDMDFEKSCEEIKQSRQQRGENGPATVPAYYFTKPMTSRSKQSLGGNIPGAVLPDLASSPESKIPANAKTSDLVVIDGKTYFKFYKKECVKRKTTYPSSKSPWCRTRRKRQRVLYYIDENNCEHLASTIDGHNGDLSDKEEDHHEEDHKDLEVNGKDENEEGTNADAQQTEEGAVPKTEDTIEINGKKYKKVYKRVRVKRTPTSRPKSPWVKPTKGSYKNVLFYVDEEGNEVEASQLISENGELSADSDATIEASPLQELAATSSQPTLNEGASTSNRLTRSTSPYASRSASLSPGGARSIRSQSAGHSPARSIKSGSRAKSEEREVITPNRMVNGGSPSKAKRKLNPESDAMDTIEEVPGPSSQSSNCSCPGENNRSRSSSPPRTSPAKSPSPVRPRATRSTDPNALQALEILNEKEPEFIINRDKLKKLLSRVVHVSRGFNVEKLQRLYSQLSRTIYNHRRDYDKTRMLSDLESAIERFK